ncbi:CCA tRNA nucleotidyltransferase [Sporosarcina sp. USHLN248]|uniref:CCA tRNA nucleotidyltransferase n=1 Tax=Sporosarcina sp. USHLN248 TaxID=3081300 RepID=UPI0030163781
MSFGTAASREVVRQLMDAGYEAVFVGGSVRDHLLGKEASDIDIATSAMPTEVKEVFSHTFDVGIQHGTVLVMMYGEPIEVTTYRTEGTYADHRRPDEVHFVRSLEEDLKRRDFTMNALALTLDGLWIDPFGGQEDIKKRLIRAVGNADDRFQEDALRIIRAVRFASTLGFAIERDTANALKNNAPLIGHISVERIKTEMDKLFIGKYVERALTILVESNLHRELPLFPQEIGMLSACAPFSSPLHGWAAFMIVGKFNPQDLFKAYKLSNQDKQFLTAVSEAFQERLAGKFGTDQLYKYTESVLQITERIFHALYPNKEYMTIEELREMKGKLPIQSKEDLCINGKDLMEWTGQRGGKWLGEWLYRAERAVLYGQCINTSKHLKEWFLSEFKRQA